MAHLPALAAESAREAALLMAEALPAKAGAAARLLRATPGSFFPRLLFLAVFLLGGVPQEQKMLKGYLRTVVSHQVYKYAKITTP